MLLNCAIFVQVGKDGSLEISLNEVFSIVKDNYFSVKDRKLCLEFI